MKNSFRPNKNVCFLSGYFALVAIDIDTFWRLKIVSQMIRFLPLNTRKQLKFDGTGWFFGDVWKRGWVLTEVTGRFKLVDL